jgi:DNA-binding NarL/FixJ family response regulator
MQTTIVPPIPPAKWRILIVDGHSLIRAGVTALLDGEPDLMVCAGVGTGPAALEAIGASKPDLVIADLWLQGGDGLGFIRTLGARHPDLPVLVLTMHEGPHYVRSALEAGARGCLSKRDIGEALLNTIRSLLGGESN